MWFFVGGKWIIVYGFWFSLCIWYDGFGVLVDEIDCGVCMYWIIVLSICCNFYIMFLKLFFFLYYVLFNLLLVGWLDSFGIWGIGNLVYNFEERFIVFVVN